MTDITLEQEQGLLGAVLRGARNFKSLSKYKIRDPAHQKILICMITLQLDNARIDLSSLTQKLRENYMLDDVGGAQYLTRLSESCEDILKPPPISLAPNATKIKAKPYM